MMLTAKIAVEVEILVWKHKLKSLEWQLENSKAIGKDMLKVKIDKIQNQIKKNECEHQCEYTDQQTQNSFLFRTTNIPMKGL